jgi:hypothetical protein
LSSRQSETLLLSVRGRPGTSHLALALCLKQWLGKGQFSHERDRVHKRWASNSWTLSSSLKLESPTGCSSRGRRSDIKTQKSCLWTRSDLKSEL